MPNCSEQGTGLAPNCRVTCAGHRLQLMQRLARELCIESWQTKKLLFPLFFPLYTEKVYDLLLLHSFYSPKGAYLKGISALVHSQE